MRIAIAQINTRIADFESTAVRMESFSQMAVDQGAELVVFPMTTLTGPLPVDFPNREGYGIDLLATLTRLAESVPCPCLVPVVSEMDNEPYHDVMLLEDGKMEPLRLRSYLQGGNKAEERGTARWLTTFELGDLRFALAQTYEDLDDLVDASLELDVVVFVSDYSYALDDAGSALGSALRENRYKADALALDAWLVAAGSLGGYGMQVYGGSSFAITPEGELVASAPAFEESLLMADVSPAAGSSHADQPQTLEPEIYNRSLHLWQALVLGLHDYFCKKGHTDAALVLDGGAASSLLAALASDALGPTHVHAVVGAVDDGEHTRIARDVAHALHVDVHPSALDYLSAEDDSALKADVASACLAHLARQTKSVALEHADKTFLALEATSSVCRVAELLPFGDVYRTDLLELAHLRNTISPIIPAEAFELYDVPRVDGIERAGKTAEMRLKQLDVMLATHIEWERSLTDVAARQGDAALCESVITSMRDAEEMRGAWPPCLVASSRPLFMARMPYGMAWRDRIRTEDERSEGKRAADALAASMYPQDEGRPPSPGLSELMKGLEVELQGDVLPHGIGHEGIESALGEIIGLLQDLSSGIDTDQPSIEGPFGPLTWGSPFSEN